MRSIQFSVRLIALLLFSGGVIAKEELREPYWTYYRSPGSEWGDFEDPEQIRAMFNEDQESRYAACIAGDDCASCTKRIIDPITKATAQSSFYNGKLTVLSNGAGVSTNWYASCRGKPPVVPPVVTPYTGGTISVHTKRICPPGYGARNSAGNPTTVTIDGYTMPSYNTVCFKDIPDCPACPSARQAKTLFGNPIDAMSNAKIEVDTDYVSGDGLLRVTRSYSSALGRWVWNHDASVLDFSGRSGTRPISSNLMANVKMMPPGVRTAPVPAVEVPKPFPLSRTNPSLSTSEVWVSLANGSRLYFTEPSANTFATLAPDRPQLSVSGGQWMLRSAGRTAGLHIFNTAGDLAEQWTADGKKVSYQRGATTLTVTSWPGGRQLVYSRSSSDLLPGTYDTVTLPDARQLQYSIDDLGMVAQITHADSSTKNYLYNEPAYAPAPSTGAAWNRLTGLVDEDNVRVGTYTYEENVPRSTESAGGINKFTFTPFFSRNEVINPLNGKEIVFWSTGPDGERRMTQHAQPAGAGSGVATTNLTYDASGNIAMIADYRGYRTCLANDLTRGLETTRVEGVSGSFPTDPATHTIPANTRQRKISTQWHPVWNFPVARAEPKKLIKWIYNGQPDPTTSTTASCAPTVAVLPDGSPIAVVCKRIEQETTDTTGTLGFSAVLTDTPRVWTYTYNDYGQVLTADGPRSDVSDVVSYTYYSCDTGSECGQVATITNAAGHTTAYSTYNAHGQPLTIVDPNGVTTTLTYDLRQRMKSRTVGYEQTSFSYRATGLLERVTLPDTSYLEYSYDPAHRLTGISDASGNRIEYTLDNAGNRTAENVYDPSNTLSRTRGRVFDALSRVWEDKGAAGTAAVTTVLAYDANGNQTNINAPLGRNTIQQYDELNRLKQLTDPLNGITQYGYNALDQLVSVTDPRSKVTGYTYDAFGSLLQQVSPDTGTTVNTYDAAGNLLTSTDARNLTVTYSYDALNRVLSASYPDQTIGYTYDTGSSQNGRLTEITDNSGSTRWSYDPQGRVLSKQQSMGITKGVGYAYDLSGRLQTLTLPSGNTITYGYTDGKATSLTLNGSISLLSDALYEPFGPTRGWTWGNGTFSVRGYNSDGLIDSVDSAGLKTYGYDDAFRITSITDPDNASLNQSYGYDLLDRLTSATGPSLNQGWDYDANGNRKTQTGSSASTFTTSSTSNRLSTVAGALTRTYSYDDAGNTTSDGTATFVYNNAGRMISATNAGATTTYAYNALGQRVRKTQSGSSRYFVYDEAGHLLGEYDNAGALIQETVWFGDTPVATLRPNGANVDVLYIHSDHLNTPRKITRPSDNVVVWRWDGDPFGTMTVSQDPDGDAVAINYGLRFPGQYFDAETGLHYNYYRDGYDPITGRYTQSDPIGLHGGIATYSYADGNPLMFSDPSGLDPSPGIGDQINPFGSRGDGTRDYTAWFDQRFPRTIAGAMGEFQRRIFAMICANIGATSLPGLADALSDIDVQPNMQRFGDAPQNWWERKVQIGKFELKTDPIAVSWVQGCGSCFTYTTLAFVSENTGDNSWYTFGLTRERRVRMGDWPLSGGGCCGGK